MRPARSAGAPESYTLPSIDEDVPIPPGFNVGNGGLNYVRNEIYVRNEMMRLRSWNPFHRRKRNRMLRRPLSRNCSPGLATDWVALPGRHARGQGAVAQHRGIADPETGARYTIKVCSSERRQQSAEWTAA